MMMIDKKYITLQNNEMRSMDLFFDGDSNIASVEYHFTLLERSNLHINLVALHQKLLQIKIVIEVRGQYAKAKVLGAYVLSDNAIFDIETLQNHQAVHGNSEIILKGFLKDKAQVSVNGLMYVAVDAKKTYALQENKNIVTSACAVVKTVPSIEVLNNDVQCFHGAATATFQADQQWYLQSKGFNPSVARQVLVYSFFDDVVAGNKNYEYVMELICQKIL